MISTEPRSSGSVDIAATIDSGQVTAYHVYLVALTALTIVFDGFDNQLLGLALPAITSDWQLTRAAFAPVVSLGYIGMMIGGAVGGVAGDRVGRRTALLGCVFAFGAATAAISVIEGLAGLTVLRFIAGAGLGGALPNATALVAEYVPMRRRAIAVTCTIVCVPLGGALAGLFAVPALPAVGWRGMFLIGGAIPVVMALIFSRLLAESPRYLVRHPRRWPELATLLGRMGHAVPRENSFIAPQADTAAARLSSLLAPDVRRDTFALWTAFLSCLLAVYLSFSWLPSLLTTAGLSAAVASTGLAVFNLGGVVGALLGGWAIMRWGSRSMMLVSAAGAIASAVALSAMNISATGSVTAIIVMLTIAGALINAVQATMYALAANVYPTTIRAAGVGAASSVGRSGAILSGYAGPWALGLNGSASFFALMAGTLSITFAALALVRRHIPAR